MSERESDSQNSNSIDPSSIAEFSAAAIDDPGVFFATLIESLPVNIVCKDLTGRYVYVNQAFAKMLEGVPGDFLGKTDFEIIPEPLAVEHAEKDLAVIKSGKSSREFEQFVVENGSCYSLNVQRIPWRNSQNEIIGIKVVSLDITVQTKAETDMKHERFLLDSLMNHIPDSIYFKDTESRFVRTGQGQAEKFGLSKPSDIWGKTDADIFSAEHAQQARADELQIMETSQPILNKVEKETWPNAPDTWCSSTKLPWSDSEGNIVGIFGISRDITDLVLTEDALRKAKIDADSANRSKSDFLANMSHEIRTPMNAVIGITELLLDTNLTSYQREYLQMVLASGESLLALINDILDFSKIEAGKLELDPSPFEVRDAFGDTARMLAMRAHAKNLELIFSVESEVPQWVKGDLGRLRQIIINLVGNAIKFTREGEVVLKIEQEAVRRNEVTLLFSVSDTGIGIPTSKVNLIFQEFEQADASTTRDYGGTGLGLAITARLVELMEGKIWVESEPDEGSTFFFTAKLESAPDQTKPKNLKSVELRRKRALIVDDNSTNRLILNNMLLNWGMEPTTAVGVKDALDALRNAATRLEPYELVLTDVSMPGADGFQLTQAMRDDPELKDVSVIALTSGLRDGDQERAKGLGVSHQLIKPAKQSEVYEAIVDALGFETTPDAADSESVTLTKAASANKPLKVLLVEDNLVNQKLAIGILGKHNHQVIVANNGQEGIDFWKQQEFDLILMDVQMPVMDGLQATREIRSLEQVRGGHTLIMAMTARAMQRDREECLEAGMDEYLSKPIRIKVLMERLIQITKTVAAKHLPTQPDSVVAQRGADSQNSDFQPADSQPADSQITDFQITDSIDWKFALSSVNGEKKLLKALVTILTKDCPRLIKEIGDNITTKDAATLQLNSGNLQGSIQFLGETKLAQAAGKLHSMGQKQQLSGASDEFDNLQTRWQEIAFELDAFLDAA